MPLLAFLLLVARAAKAFVVPSSLNVLPSTTQSSGSDNLPDDNSFEALFSSAWLDNGSSDMMPSSPSMSNSTLALNNVSADIKYLCLDRFGTNLNPQSCRSAALNIEYQLTKPFTWGPRGTAVTYDFPIPQRWVSSDGTCIIEAILGPGDTSARASLEDVAMGAYKVVQQCVERKTPSEGGIAKDLGDGRLGIYVAKQTPSVRCYGSAAVTAIVNSCQSIMDRMDVTNELRTFGTAGTGVVVELPYTWHSADHKCIMTLRTSGPSDRESWHRIWETATFVTAMCAKQGKKGLYSQMGTNKRLYLEVAAEGVGDEETS